MPQVLSLGASFSRPQRVARTRRNLSGTAPTAGSFEQFLLNQYAQGQLTMAQVEAELEQLTTDWEYVYTG
ncbi:hypothetical protein SAMN06265337_4327 [Hymenobacter gelipurpurascens]|uniref:Uncharacterized protein n=1 Tax=Hymenobacter gelipurpurascens TaxID=89968 RepID=A0A212UHL0_9BACT|nr:hypothetical protein [Hymenobacter gelipurpurascens]SNC77725.1 hypothetical protein SAMN06265337_4327 [Hymenobacter gelipurpurascens]